MARSRGLGFQNGWHDWDAARNQKQPTSENIMRLADEPQLVFTLRSHVVRGRSPGRIRCSLFIVFFQLLVVQLITIVE